LLRVFPYLALLSVELDKDVVRSDLDDPVLAGAEGDEAATVTIQTDDSFLA